MCKCLTKVLLVFYIFEQWDKYQKRKKTKFLLLILLWAINWRWLKGGEGSMLVVMDEGTLKTPIPNVVFTGHFCLGWWSNFAGSESGQKQSLKHLQNMVHSTFQHPPPPPHSHTLSVYTVHWEGGGGGRRSERRYSTVYSTQVPYSSLVHGGNSTQAGLKIQTMSECIPDYQFCIKGTVQRDGSGRN